jgi:hypothetical protein
MGRVNSRDAVQIRRAQEVLSNTVDQVSVSRCVQAVRRSFPWKSSREQRALLENQRQRRDGYCGLLARQMWWMNREQR